MTHTPAPWTLEGFNIRISDKSYYLLNNQASIPAAELRANSQLIAAAPELLEALKDLVKANSIRMGRSAVQLRMDLAIEAINKAEGK